MSSPKPLADPLAPEPDTTTTAPDTTAACAGDWRLGSTFMHGSEIGVPCAPNDAPQNCATGDFITFADGECICIARCAALQNIVVGDACNPSGSWKCQPILATNPDANSGEYCVPLEWNLCQGTPDHHNPQCTVNGANCDFDTECCSGWCSSDTGMCE